MITDSTSAKKDSVVPILQLLLVKKQTDANIVDVNGYTPLMANIQSGSYSVVMELCRDRKVNLLLEDKQGRSVAHHVAQSPFGSSCSRYQDTISIFKYLRKRGVDINKPDHNGVTPFAILLKEGNHQVAMFFTKNHLVDPKVNLPNGMNPLLFCIAEGNAGEVGRIVLTCQMLMEAGVDVSATDKNGNNALHLACSQVWGVDIAVLINGGVDQNQRNRKNQLPVFISLSQGDYTTSNLLLRSKGLDLRLISPEEWSFITTAAADYDSFLAEVLQLMDEVTLPEVMNRCAVPSAMNSVAPKGYPSWFNGCREGIPLFQYCFQMAYADSLQTLFHMKLFKNFLDPDQDNYASRLSFYLKQQYFRNSNVFHLLASHDHRDRCKNIIKDLKQLTGGNIELLLRQKNERGLTPVDIENEVLTYSTSTAEKRKRQYSDSIAPKKKRRMC